MDENVNVRGKDIIIPATPMALFSLFTNLESIVDRLPEEYRNQVSVSGDVVKLSVQGMNLTLELDQKVPFSYVGVRSVESSVPFRFEFRMEPMEFDKSLFHLEMSCKMNMMMKMMIGGKLQKVVDKISDQIELALSGQMPSVDDLKNTSFS